MLIRLLFFENPHFPQVDLRILFFLRACLEGEKVTLVLGLPYQAD